jgi:hypothetical protein
LAIAFVLDSADGDIDKYDQVIEKTGLRPGGPGPSGALFHWGTRTENGIRVTDVWESAEQFQKFADEQIGPLIRPTEGRRREQVGADRGSTRGRPSHTAGIGFDEAGP